MDQRPRPCSGLQQLTNAHGQHTGHPPQWRPPLHEHSVEDSVVIVWASSALPSEAAFERAGGTSIDRLRRLDADVGCGVDRPDRVCQQCPTEEDEVEASVAQQILGEVRQVDRPDRVHRQVRRPFHLLGELRLVGRIDVPGVVGGDVFRR